MFSNDLLTETSGKTMSHWQIAADGIWEEAREISVQPNEKDLQDLVDWVNGTTSDIAVEAFFGDKETEFFFYGIRIQNLSKPEQIKFLTNLIRSISKEDDLDAVIQVIQNVLSDSTILKNQPNLLELGAEGFWKSYGSYVVWKNGQDNIASVEDIEREASQFFKPFERAFMLEFAWKEPLPMWLGIPISEKNDQMHCFSESRYKKFTDMVSI